MNASEANKANTAGRLAPVLIVVVGLLLFAATFRLGGGATTAGGPFTPSNERATLRPFALMDLDGRTWDLAAQRGKVVLVNYWATWCPPCRQETPALVRVANELRPRGLEVVGISLDGGGPGVVRDFVKSYDVPYPMLMAADEPDVAQGVDSLPLTLLLDRRGRLAKSYVGAVRESALRSDIEQLLAEP